MIRTHMTIIAVSAALLLGACSGSDKKASIERKLRSCDVLSEGEFNLGLDVSDENRCQIDCVLDADCDAVMMLVCSNEPPATLEACFEACGTGGPPDFTCADGGDTIPGHWVCDCEEDCSDGSDEADCSAADCFTCADGEWTFSTEWVCDCYEDCSDGSDEADCPGTACFECADGSRTLPTSAQCDCWESCEDGSDEAGCPASTCFSCADGEGTIRSEYVCDAEEDCEDGSDEPDRCAEYLCP